jgi:hypothetical protein
MTSQRHTPKTDKDISKRGGSQPEAQLIPESFETLTRAVGNVRLDSRLLTPHDVLQLQRTIGNQAVQRMLSGRVQRVLTNQDLVTADTVLTTAQVTKVLDDLIAQKSASFNAQSQVTLLDDTTFDTQFKMDHPNTKTAPQEVNGYNAKDGKIYVRENVSIHTVIHEMIHGYSNPALGKTLGFCFDEAVTEYFACEIDQQQPTGEYAEYMKWLLDILPLNSDILADAYFNGHVNALIQTIPDCSREVVKRLKPLDRDFLYLKQGLAILSLPGDSTLKYCGERVGNALYKDVSDFVGSFSDSGTIALMGQFISTGYNATNAIKIFNGAKKKPVEFKFLVDLAAALKNEPEANTVLAGLNKSPDLMLNYVDQSWMSTNLSDVNAAKSLVTTSISPYF